MTTMTDAATHARSRPNRPAAARTPQYRRAQARSLQVLLRSFKSLDHKGCQRSQIGAALYEALLTGKGSVPDDLTGKGSVPDDILLPTSTSIADIMGMLGRHEGILQNLASTVAGLCDKLEIIHAEVVSASPLGRDMQHVPQDEVVEVVPAVSSEVAHNTGAIDIGALPPPKWADLPDLEINLTGSDDDEDDDAPLAPYVTGPDVAVGVASQVIMECEPFQQELAFADGCNHCRRWGERVRRSCPWCNRAATG